MVQKLVFKVKRLKFRKRTSMIHVYSFARVLLFSIFYKILSFITCISKESELLLLAKTQALSHLCVHIF